MGQHVTFRVTATEARILREMAADRLFTLENQPIDERAETPRDMAAARRAVRKLSRAFVAANPQSDSKLLHHEQQKGGCA